MKAVKTKPLVVCWTSEVNNYCNIIETQSKTQKQLDIIMMFIWRVNYKLKGSVEKGCKSWFEVKIKIGAVQLNIGTQAGFHVRNTVVHVFLDLRSKIQRISVLLLRKKFCWTELAQVKREWFLLFSAWTKTKEFNLESAVLLFSLCQF